jgi:hypothetical protein
MWHTYPEYVTDVMAALLDIIHVLYLFCEFYLIVEHLCLVVWQVQSGWHSETCLCQAHNIGMLYYLLGCIVICI